MSWAWFDRCIVSFSSQSPSYYYCHPFSSVIQILLLCVSLVLKQKDTTSWKMVLLCKQIWFHIQPEHKISFPNSQELIFFSFSLLTFLAVCSSAFLNLNQCFCIFHLHYLREEPTFDQWHQNEWMIGLCMYLWYNNQNQPNLILMIVNTYDTK